MKVVWDWDPSKAESNYKKHHVSFDEARTVFDDPVLITFYDTEHSVAEDRYITLGLSRKNRLLMIAHTEQGRTIRIISARKAIKNERRFYEESK